jgi:hypothetical protein
MNMKLITSLTFIIVPIKKDSYPSGGHFVFVDNRRLKTGGEVKAGAKMSVAVVGISSGRNYRQ